MEEYEEDTPGFPLGWVVLFLFVGLAAVVGVGAFAYDSESAGVLASQVASFPCCFSAVGMLVAIIAHFAGARGAVRSGVPLGCGCVSGLLGIVMVFVFYTAIWPSL